MKTDKKTLTIQEFSALLSDQTDSAPEIKAFGQLATIETPAKVGEALKPSTAWGWW